MKLARLFPRLLAAAAIALAACTAPEPVPLTSPKDVAGAGVVRKPVQPPVPSAATGAPAARPKPGATIIAPAGAQYVCVAEVGGERKQTAIQFAPKVARLCQSHPEMGPCQYERNVCRRSGGRVYTAAGVEIGMDTEAEYDRKVLRVRLKAN